MSGKRRHSEPNAHRESLTYPSRCQNYLRDQVDEAARIRVKSFGVPGGGTEEGAKALMIGGKNWAGDGSSQSPEGNFTDGLSKYLDRGRKHKLLMLPFQKSLKSGLFLVSLWRAREPPPPASSNPPLELNCCSPFCAVSESHGPQASIKLRVSNFICS